MALPYAFSSLKDNLLIPEYSSYGFLVASSEARWRRWASTRQYRPRRANYLVQCFRSRLYQRNEQSHPDSSCALHQPLCDNHHMQKRHIFTAILHLRCVKGRLGVFDGVYYDWARLYPFSSFTWRRLGKNLAPCPRQRKKGR